MLHDVVAVEARADFKVWVRFEDGLEGEADLSDLAGGTLPNVWRPPAHAPGLPGPSL